MAFDPDEPHPETCADFAIMEARPGAMERFWRLAVETSAYQKRLKAAGIFNYPTWIDIDQAARFRRYLAKQIPQEHHDATLFSRWDDWDAEYEAIYEASPKWRLKLMISRVSETVSCISWPNRWERDVWEWAVSPKQGEKCPFYHYRAVLDGGFRNELESLVRECDGFLYRCEESGYVVFAPTDKLPKIWKHQDHLASIDREKLFGFFADYSRPNPRTYARQPTETEERIFAELRRRKSLQSRIREGLRKRFGRSRS